MNDNPRMPHISLGSPSGRSFVRLRLSRRTAWNVFSTLCVIATLVFGAKWAAEKFLAKPAGSVGTKLELAPGPWGKVTAQPILIEAPASLLSVNFRLGDNRWYFPARDPGEVGSVLRKAGLTEAQIAQIQPLLQPVKDADGLLAVLPPPALVRSLDMDVRSKLYETLALIPQNFAQSEPFRTTALHLDAWLNPEKLPPELVDEVKGLMWRRGSGLFFSDYNLVADAITSPVLKLELLKQLTHKASVVLTLEVPPGGEVGQLVDYYGVNGRRDKVEPILRALSEAGGGTIGFSNMLPAFARAKLYRFPDPLAGKDISQDCHWTTFNFFNQSAPDDTLNDAVHVSEVLKAMYEPVSGQPRFGDVVLLTLPDSSSIHSATYIADDIVFTKNGPSLAAPYLLSTVQEMLAFYPNSESIRLAYYRLKGS
jgi:hypothetical protein